MEKVALVTGGTKGIGKGITLHLLENGYRVIATYANDVATAEALIESIDCKDNLYLFRCDQSFSEEVYKLVDYIKNFTSHLDCVVCNAGSTLRKGFQQITDEDWKSVMDVNINSNFTLIREFYPIIPKGGRIIFIGSLMGMHPHATSLVYGVSKSAVHSLAQNLVKVFEHTNTTVNVIVPGFVETEWQKDKPEHIRENIYKKTAVARFAEIQEIVSAFDFCLNNGFVNGALIEVSGGYNYK